MSKADKAAGQAVSPALDPAATIVTMREAARILRTSKVVMYGHLHDGTLQSFRVGARRYCTLKQIQDCVLLLAERGAEKKVKRSAKHAERRMSAR